MLARYRSHLPGAAFVCALVLLSSAGVTSYLDARSIVRTSAEVDETHVILKRLGTVSTGVERLVTTARVFVLSGQEEFAAPLGQIERQLDDEIAHLRELLAGTDLLMDLATLERLVERRAELGREYIDMRRRLGLEQTTERIPAGGEQLTEEIRGLIATMETVAQSRLDERRRVASAHHRRTLATIVLFGLISLVALLTAYFGFRQQARERAELERQIVLTGEQERDRIARDLHDGLGQELTGFSLRLGALAKQLDHEGSAHAETLRSLSDQARNSISETRRLSRSLSPGVWSDLGICAALKSLAREVDAHAGVSCSASCSSTDDLNDGEISVQLIRIAQEAINNALRHSGASEIDLRYGREGNSVYLEVLDNGVGIPDEAERAEGLGLRSMRYRARMLGGDLKVEARPRGGTEVRCAFSLPA